MRLLLCAVVTTALCGSVSAFDEPKKADDKPSVSDQLKTIQTDFQTLGMTLQKEYAAAKTDKEKEEIVAKFNAEGVKAAEKALALATANAKDPASFDAALFAMMRGGEAPVGAKAGEFIAANHADNMKLKTMLPQLGRMGEGGQKLLQGLHDKATDKTEKGTTLYYLASAKLEAADRGTPGKTVPAEKTAAAFKDAETLLNKAAKEYGDIEVPARGGATEKVSKLVEKQLFFLNNLTVGKTLPDASVEDLEGKKVKISDYRGKVVALDIWATWCGPCVAMIPHERELVKRLKDKPFVLISLSADDKKETLTKFMEKQEMPWTHWWNGGAKGAALETYQVQFYPTIYVLDDKGVIRFKHVRGEAMDKAVEELLKEVKPKG